MSYAEPGPSSDVYVYQTAPDRWLCHWKKESYEAKSAQDMWEHLQTHRRRHHRVPEEALDRLWHEARGLPYETRVQRALKDWEANGWPI